MKEELGGHRFGNDTAQLFGDPNKYIRVVKQVECGDRNYELPVYSL